MNDLIIEDNGEFISLKLNRPQVHNAFNEKVIEQMINACEAIESNEKVRFVTLSGEGKSFSAGADLTWMKSMKEYSEIENIADSRKLGEMFARLDNLSVPLVGKVQGAALGGGVGLVSVCDYVICDKESKFGFTEARLGLAPAVISPFVMNKIGRAQARAYFCSGAVFGSHEAFHMGLVQKVSSNLEEDFSYTLKDFLKAAPKAARTCKKLAKQNFKTEELYTLIAKLRVADEGQEGMSALLEKRKPLWQR